MNAKLRRHNFLDLDCLFHQGQLQVKDVLIVSNALMLDVVDTETAYFSSLAMSMNLCRETGQPRNLFLTSEVGIPGPRPRPPSAARPPPPPPPGGEGEGAVPAVLSREKVESETRVRLETPGLESETRNRKLLTETYPPTRAGKGEAGGGGLLGGRVRAGGWRYSAARTRGAGFRLEFPIPGYSFRFQFPIPLTRAVPGDLV